MGHGTQGVALGYGLAGLSARAGPQTRLFSYNLHLLNFSGFWTPYQTRLKIQQSHAPERWPCSLRVRGPHFASKVSYNAGAATDDCAGQCKSPLRGRCCQYLIFYLDHPKVMRRPSGIIKSSLRLLQVIDLRPRVALPSAASNATVGRE